MHITLAYSTQSAQVFRALLMNHGVHRTRKAVVVLLSPLPLCSLAQQEAAQLSYGRHEEISAIASYFLGEGYSSQITGLLVTTVKVVPFTWKKYI